jgi:phosphopantothenoylcysteine decarboxylase / phosphopantothenate---cysteine ligase
VPARIILGVGAGIAAYKVCELLRRFTESGHQVRVIPTGDSLRFVGADTWAALSGQPVTASVWDNVHEVPHVRLGRDADLVLVAPATADLLARAASGLAGDLLTAVLLTARCPVMFAPAMHTEMWEHPATQANVSLLRERGCVVLEPASGRLTGQDSGPGRLPEPAGLWQAAVRMMARGSAGMAPDLTGLRVVVSAGGTREALDPVRFLGNWSSGRQGYALAGTAVARGAEVTLVTANVALPDPAGVKVVEVVSAAEMRSAMLAAVADADAAVMAAAVADFRPESHSASKIKKTGSPPAPLRLLPNPDILAELVSRRRPGQVIAGFAAETDNVLAHGRAKLTAKGCDLLVVNQVGRGLGLGTADNEAVVLAADGTVTQIPRGPKEVLADVVWDMVLARLPGRSQEPPGPPV